MTTRRIRQSADSAYGQTAPPVISPSDRVVRMHLPCQNLPWDADTTRTCGLGKVIVDNYAFVESSCSVYGQTSANEQL
jgi:hypothetical protein